MNIEGMKKTLEEFLSGYEVDISQLADKHNSYRIYFFKDFPIDFRAVSSEAQLVRDVGRSISESPLFASQLATKDERIAELEAEVAELEVYKKHFDVEMRLRHGEQ